jgi:hypothetical protein
MSPRSHNQKPVCFLLFSHFLIYLMKSGSWRHLKFSTLSKLPNSWDLGLGFRTQDPQATASPPDSDRMSSPVTAGVRIPASFLRPFRPPQISRPCRLSPVPVRASSDSALEVCVKASTTVPDRLGDCKLSYLSSPLLSSRQPSFYHC